MEVEPIVVNMCFSVEMENDLKKLSRLFSAEIDVAAFSNIKSMVQNWPEFFFADPNNTSRLFPNGIAPIILNKGSKRVIRPMRYRVRPAFSKQEVPSQYNLFNARRDSLLSRKTWSELIFKQHGIFAFTHFYEWVERGHKKKLVRFFPEGKELMWAPVLYSKFQTRTELEFESFAIITDEPPPEVLNVGHDRCPLFLKEGQIESWLNANDLNAEKLNDLFDLKEKVYFGHEFLPEAKKEGPIQLNLFDYPEK